MTSINCRKTSNNDLTVKILLETLLYYSIKKGGVPHRTLRNENATVMTITMKKSNKMGPIIEL